MLRRAALLALVLFPQDSVDDLIRQLGSDEFDAREKASDELLRIGAPALPALRKAAESGDAEVRYRIKLILPRIEWSLPKDAPDDVVGLAAQFADADDAGKVKRSEERRVGKECRL